MKDINKVRRELDELCELDIDLLNPPVKTSPRAKTKVQFLNLVLKYLESQPTEEFIKNEIISVESKLQNRKSYQDLWATDKVFDSAEKRIAAYEKEMGMPELRKQLDMLNYLIG